MKILIIEDMNLIREGIVQLVKRCNYPYDAILEACDGQEGLQNIKDHQPDIVITDIRMPKMDGLELIKKAKEINDTIEFIIVTGHAEFEYAKKAVDLGVSGFILKPINQEKFDEVLKKAVQKYEESSKVKNIVEEKKILEKLRNEHTIHHQVNKALFDKGNTPYTIKNNCLYCMLFIHLSKEMEGIKEQMEQFLSSLNLPLAYHIVENVTNSQEYFIIIYDQKKNIVTVESKRLEAKLREKMSSLDNEIFIWRGQLADSICKSMYEEVKKKLIMELFEAQKEDNDVKGRTYDIKDNLKFLQSHLKNKDYEKVKKIINKLFTYESLKKNTQTRIIVLYSLISGAMFEAFNIPMDEIEKNTLFKSSYVLDHSKTIDDIKQQLIVLLDDLIKANSDISFDKNYIKHIKDYIDNHYTEDITVNSLAKKLNISSSYLSNAFKKKYNISPFSYITSLRMDKACQLLLESDFHINSISETVGYSDVQHFYRVFKKHTGVTPLKYRSNKV